VVRKTWAVARWSSKWFSPICGQTPTTTAGTRKTTQRPGTTGTLKLEIGDVFSSGFGGFVVHSRVHSPDDGDDDNDDRIVPTFFHSCTRNAYFWHDYARERAFTSVFGEFAARRFATLVVGSM
jgi:hypothetical protein